MSGRQRAFSERNREQYARVFVFWARRHTERGTGRNVFEICSFEPGEAPSARGTGRKICEICSSWRHQRGKPEGISVRFLLACPVARAITARGTGRKIDVLIFFVIVPSGGKHESDMHGCTFTSSQPAATLFVDPFSILCKYKPERQKRCLWVCLW